jgi:hypothetical protein
MLRQAEMISKVLEQKKVEPKKKVNIVDPVTSKPVGEPWKFHRNLGALSRTRA